MNRLLRDAAELRRLEQNRIVPRVARCQAQRSAYRLCRRCALWVIDGTPFCLRHAAQRLRAGAPVHSITLQKEP
jgi:hypothetical protein